MATTLQTVAIIRARDMFSGPVTRMANRVLAAQRRIQTTARAARSVGSGMSVGVTAPIGMAAGSLFRTALAFDKMRNSAQAADIATNVLTAMKLPMHDAVTAGISFTRVNDALAFAAANSNTDVRNLGESFKFAGPLASMVGMSVDDLAAAFKTMAQSGMKGSEAGVAMRSAIVRMLRPSKGMRAELAKLGIDLNDYITGAREMSSQDLVTSFKAQGLDLWPGCLTPNRARGWPHWFPAACWPKNSSRSGPKPKARLLPWPKS